MQINQVYSSNSKKSNNNNNENKIQAQPSFGAAGNPLVAFATFIENNGFLGEFLTVDTVGMAAPRTIQGYNRNREELKHPNYKAGGEEFKRELLSGPAFFFVPAGVLAVAALIKGKVAKVAVPTLDSFKAIMQKASSGLNDFKNSKTIKEKFLDSFADTAFEGYEKSDKISEIKEILSNLIDKKISNKKATKSAEDALTVLNKTNGKFVDNTSIVKLGGKEMDIAELIKDIPNYLEDFTNKAVKSTDSTTNFIEKFHKKANMIRRSTNIAAVTALSAFLLIIPAIYQKDKKFPGLEGLDVNDASQKKLTYHLHQKSKGGPNEN